jgi:CheY-like chemotaxis protein
MPGAVRSPELARRARARLPGVAVLFTSGYTDNAIVHGGRLDQGIELLSKPYAREVLARKIRHVLRNQQQRNGARREGARCNGTRSDGTGRDGGMPPLRILFVEDDDLIRMATTDMLTGLGHSVIEAGDAVQALGILDSTAVDVLMTDIGLPGMSGNRLAAEVRRKSPELTVIYATGGDGAPSSDDELLAEGVLVLRKPYDAAALDRILRAANGRR